MAFSVNGLSMVTKYSLSTLFSAREIFLGEISVVS